MNCYADTGYIHAKIHALHSMLLMKKDYYEMARSGSLSNLVSGLDSGNIREDYIKIKERIFQNQINLIISLAESSESYRRVFILFLRFFELLNLKLLYAKAFGRTPVPYQWYDIGVFAVLDRGMLTENTDVAAILKYSMNTWMRDIVTPENAGSFEEVEFAIDRASLRLAVEFPYSMSMSRGSDSIRVIGGLAAYFRIVWTWRLSFLYSWDADSVRRYMDSNIVLPERGIALYNAINDWERILTKYAGSEYGSSLEGGPASIKAAEKVMERVLIKDLSRTFHENFHSINTVICYLALLYRQIWNLFSLVEGLRFGLGPDAIMENIICEV